MAFKQQSVIGTKFILKGGKEVNLSDKNNDSGFKPMIYLRSYVDKINLQHKGMRQVIAVDWEETFKQQLEAGNTGWKDQVLEDKTDEAYDLKMDMNFPTSESYTIASRKPKYKGEFNDYLLIVEKDIETLKSLEDADNEDDNELKELKAKAKELGIVLKGKQTIASITKKIEDLPQD